MMEHLQLPLIISGGALLLIAVLSWLGNHYTLNNIKSKTVGDGQHGTARWATPKEIRKTYAHVPFRVADWRRGKNRPTQQGLVLGSVTDKHGITALVDCDDIHCLMIMSPMPRRTNEIAPLSNHAHILRQRILTIAYYAATHHQAVIQGYNLR